MAIARTKKKATAPVAPDLIAFADFDDEDEGEGDEEEWCEDDSCGFDEDDEGEGDEEEDEEAPRPAKRKPTRPRAPGDDEKLIAFRAGKAAWASGITADDIPDLHPALIKDWSCGWRVAAVEAAQGAGVIVHTPYDPAERDIAALRRTYNDWQPKWASPMRDDPRQRFPAAPWTMADLIGTTWRNIHTGSIVTVGPVRADSMGDPHLCCDDGNPTQLHFYLRDHIGIWIWERYVVEHWIRVDHWTSAEGIQWYAMRSAYLRDQIARARAQISASDRTNARLRMQDIEGDQKQLRIALDELRDFAEQHQLAATPDLINGTRFRRASAGEARQSEQLSLF